ncbi:MAG: short-chain dehydrogenase [gamma proteobacterium symbiont of Ctena orbiculata]|nr:MAG: short-chain dehydrogenase [gamma proteobacterium symbiont of Ctena orbiculata]PVV11968.1 MAG: short-chain dehydrogenase [gamma proteobacterium symbiont of Ctena orbiculata]PVV18338.1 MAG: short-chain dehydrogenase [gamma proteobacterium symbiont of Ctena orbiculata]
MENGHQESPRKLLVTGASGGIGDAITRRLLDRGHQVVALSRDFSRCSDQTGLDKRTVDLAELDALPRRLAEIMADHPDLDGAVLNAGSGRFGNLEEFSYQQISELVTINLTQHLYVARALVPLLKKMAPSDLITIGSEAALTGGRKGAVYSACKFALRGFSQSMRAECSGSGVRVSLINPGMVDTGFYQNLNFKPGEKAENALRADDIANAVMLVLEAHPGTVFDEINLNPLKRVIAFKN